MERMEMSMDEWEEYPYEGAFYETAVANPEAPLLEQRVEERLVLATVCDIQQHTAYGGAVYTAGYDVWLPMPKSRGGEAAGNGELLDAGAGEAEGAEPGDAGAGADDESDADADGGDVADESEADAGEPDADVGEEDAGAGGTSGSWEIPLRRGMVFRGMMHGYQVDGVVKCVGASQLGMIVVQIDDLTEQ